MNYFTPTPRNILRLWRWAKGPSTRDVVRMDWATEFTQEDALRWLRSRVDARVLRGAPLSAEDMGAEEVRVANVKQDTRVVTREEVSFTSDEIAAVMMAHAETMFAKLRGVYKDTTYVWSGEPCGIIVRRESVRYKPQDGGEGDV